MTKSKQYLACPTCGSVEGFTSYERILASADVSSFSVDEFHNIIPDYAGETKVDWDTQMQIDGGAGAYNCNNCRIDFHFPVSCNRAQLLAIRKQWATLQKVSA